MKLLDSQTEWKFKKLEAENKFLRIQINQNQRYIEQLKDRISFLEHRKPIRNFFIKFFYERP